MANFTAAVRQFVQGEEGATMVEYGLMLTFIACACIAALTLLGTNVNSLFTTASTSLAPAAS